MQQEHPKRSYKDCLTNEFLRDKCKSQFNLILYAIGIAEDMIEAGRDSGRYPTKNVAFGILSDIVEGKEVPEQTVSEQKE